MSPPAAPAAPLFELAGRRVFVAGDRGMVGAALVRRLAALPVTVLTAARADLDLTRQAAVEAWMARQRPEVVIVAAARVGGIAANAARPADFLEENLLIAANLIGTARAAGVAKLLFLGSSCIYPRDAAQPIAEAALLSGPLEPSNQWYAVAKIAGLMLARAQRRQHGADFISAMPTNLYGPGDSFDLASSHVVPALMRKMHEAREAGAAAVEVWGSGTPRREFLHVDDLADACVHLLRHYSGEEHVNVGCGTDLTIAELATLVAEVTGYRGALRFDPTMPDGTPRKLLDVTTLANLGWQPRIPLRQGLAETYRWFRAELSRALPAERSTRPDGAPQASGPRADKLELPVL